jgi:GT2 family glycosyltransferase
LKLSVIIVNYNVRYFLELCLKSTQAAIQEMDAEIIVVDNLSSDDSCDMMRTLFPEIQLIANTENRGFAKANNQGVAIAKGEYVCILNPDTVVAEDTFTKILAFAQAHPDAGAIGARLIDGTGKFLPECKRNLPRPKVAFQKIFGTGDLYYARDVKQTENGKVAVLVGAFMWMRTEIYKEVNGFDEQYFMYGEDIDLSYTITKAGYQNYYVGDAPVIHYKGESTARDAVYRKRFYGAMRIFYDKHLKSNPIESMLVRAGLWYATLSRKRMPVLEEIIPTGYAILNDDIPLAQKLTTALGKRVERNVTIDDAVAGTEIIFDANHRKYSECIAELLRSQNRQLTFKIIPKNSTFALGSDHSDGRGSLIQF